MLQLFPAVHGDLLNEFSNHRHTHVNTRMRTDILKVSWSAPWEFGYVPSGYVDFVVPLRLNKWTNIEKAVFKY